MSINGVTKLIDTDAEQDAAVAKVYAIFKKRNATPKELASAEVLILLKLMTKRS